MISTFFVSISIIHIVLASNGGLPSSLPLAMTQHFQKKCEKNGHKEVFLNIENIFVTFKTCTMNLMDKDKPTINKDEIPKTVCNVIDKSEKCFKELIEKLKPCFSAEEQNNLNIIYEVYDKLDEYICYDDGKRIGEFLAEDGFHCFVEKQAAMELCLNVISDPITAEPNDVDVFDLNITKEDCNSWTKLQTCVVDVFKTCNKPISTNIIDSLFNAVREATPCSNATSAFSFAVTTLTLLMGLITAILV